MRFSCQDGISIQCNQQSHTIKGTLTLVSGDNLASHLLGGYKAPSGALHKCRHCMATSDDMQQKVLTFNFHVLMLSVQNSVKGFLSLKRVG